MNQVILTRRTGLLAAACLVSARPVLAADLPFDFSPEQLGRPLAPRSERAVAAIAKGTRLVVPGRLTVAINPGGGPPLATYATDARTVIGADPDIAAVLAETLGLSLDLVPTAWADWPLGLASGKYDAVISNVGVTEQRKEKFDFSTYRRGLHGFFVPTGSAVQAIKDPADAAGLRIIVGAGTNQERILLEWSRQNAAAGVKPLALLYYDDQPTGLLALASGRADVIVQPHAQLVFLAARDRTIRRVGVLSAGWPLKSDVAVTTRRNGGLAEALTSATNELIDNGTYAKVLARWGLEEEALERSETNPPGLPKF